MDTMFGILGRTALRIADVLDEEWGRPQERAMLAPLLIYADRPVPIDTLVEWIWSHDGRIPRSPVQAMYTYAARIRAALRRLDPPVLLVSGNGSYRLQVKRSRVDYYQFQQLMGETRALRRQGKTREAAVTGRRALDLRRGRPLDELRSDRADNWRRQFWTDEWIPANAVLIEVLLELGELDDALARLNELQAQDPNDITLAKLRITTLHRLVRHDDAIGYYFSIRQRLRRDANEAGAEHLRQYFENLTASGPQRSSGPIRAENPAAPSQLPHDVPDFVGRERLLRAIDAASLTEAGTPAPGVVVLDGPPGVGKTALAVHWGHLTRDRFPDGSLYLDLNGFSDEPQLTQSTVVDAFLAGLGHTMDPSVSDRARAMRLRALLSGRRTFVLLDNVRDSRQVVNLIPLLADALVLVTSRQHLIKLNAWKGARRLRVEPMSTDEASALLSRRLNYRELATGSDVTELSALCGGLPLAINLIAEYVAGRPGTGLPELADQLRRDGLLTIGEEGDTVASLPVLFSFSYRALSSADRRLFALLARHPGADFTAAAAGAIDGRPRSDTIRSLNVLVGAHLLDQPALDRYRYHDLIRDYALRMAEHDHAADQRAAERRFLSFYLASACAADRRVFPSHSRPPPLPVEEHVVPIEFDDAKDATAWCVRERFTLDAAIRYAASHGHDVYAWRIPHAVVAIYERLGLYHASMSALQTAVAAAGRVGDQAAEVASLQQLGMVHLSLNDFAAARQSLRYALRMDEAADDEDDQAYALHSLARLEVTLGDTEAGIARYQQCLDVADRTGNMDIQCWTHYRLGEALRDRARFDEALLQMHQAQWLATTIGDTSAQASVLTAIGAIFTERADFITAEVYCAQALRIITRIGYVAAGARVCTVLAELNRARGHLRDARQYARQSVSIYRRVNHSEGLANALEILADIQRDLGNIEAAIEGWEQSADLFHEIDKFNRVESIRAKLLKY